MARRISTFGIILGPYRNLSTLTAGTLALHPAVQVMNHGLDRLTSTAEYNFFENVDERVLERFMSKALNESQAGQRGDFGGSITFSHAYDHIAMRTAYEARYGSQLAKIDPTCLLLKDSARFQNQMMRLHDLPSFVEAFARMRFLLPIRDPLACALSNMKTDKLGLLGAPDNPTLAEALDAVLSYLGWALTLADTFPDRVFWFTEHDTGVSMFRRWAGFLGIEADERWLVEAEAVYRVVARDHDAETRQVANVRICDKLAAWPEVLHRLGLGDRVSSMSARPNLHPT